LKNLQEGAADFNVLMGKQAGGQVTPDEAGEGRDNFLDLRRLS